MMETWHDHNDRLERMLVFGLLFIVVEVVTGVFLLAWHERAAPDAVIALGSAALGIVTTLVTQHLSARNQRQPYRSTDISTDATVRVEEKAEGVGEGGSTTTTVVAASESPATRPEP